MHVACLLEGIRKSSQCFCLLVYFIFYIIALPFYLFVHVFYAARTIKIVLCVSGCYASPVSFTGSSCYTTGGHD